MNADFTQLTRALEEYGYFQNYLTFGEGNLRPWDWERTGRFLTGHAKFAWDALLCGKPVPRAQLETTLGDRAVAELLARGICSEKEGGVEFGSNSLISSGGFNFFVNRGSMSFGYFGEESKILMGLRPGANGGRTLALHTGTGAEAFSACSAAGGGEIEIEAEESLHSYIRTNVELNGLSDRAQVKLPRSVGSGVSFDAIMARIPGLIEFAEISLPPMVAGGADGHREWRLLLDRARNELTEQGRLLLIGVFYGSKEPGLVAKQLEEMFAARGLTASLNISSRQAMELGIPIFNQTLATAELCSKRDRRELLETFDKELEGLGYNHAYLIKGVAWRTRAGVTGNIVDLSEHYYGTWLT